MMTTGSSTSSPSTSPSSSSPADDDMEDDTLSISSLVHNSTQTLGVLKKAMADMSWMDLMQKGEDRRKRLNVFKTVLRELSKCCTDVQVGLRSTKQDAVASSEEVVLLREQLRSLSAEMMFLRQALGMKAASQTHTNGLPHLVTPMQADQGYMDPMIRESTSSIPSHHNSSSSGCSCGTNSQLSPYFLPSSSAGTGTRDPYTELEDLVHMSGPLTEEAVLKVLHHRWQRGECQTRIGPVLVNINPYRGIPTEQVLQHSRHGHHPHLHNVANTALKQLIETGTSQSIILSGATGSGKTYASQLLLRQLHELAGGGAETESFKHLVNAFTVLRSLGCAKTKHNSNSSRMGQYIEVMMSNCSIYRTKLHCYWLDQSRVVQPPQGERGYHIFYQMLAGLSAEERVKLHLTGYSAKDLHYLNNVTEADDSERDRIRFDAWRKSLTSLGVHFFDVMRVMAAILLLGNIQFIDDGGFELDIKGNNEIKSVAALLGVSGVALYRGLTTRTRNLKGQVFKSLCDAQSANQNRDSLAKALYCRTVSAVIRKVNSITRHNNTRHYSATSSGSDDTLSNDSLGCKPMRHQPSPVPSKSSTNQSSTSSHSSMGDGFISILDMFGLESNECNKFEQLCVNFSAETIEQFYTTRVFKHTQDVCRQENVHCDINVEYCDNTPCLQFLLAQDHGLFSVIDSESRSLDNTCDQLIQTLNVKCAQSNGYYNSALENSHQFTIKHSSQNITYDAGDFLDANSDVISDDVITIFQKRSCNFGFTTHLFSQELKTLQGGSPKGLLFRISPSPPRECSGKSETFTTYSQDLVYRLDSLIKTLDQTQTHFVRCIKSNNKEEPTSFDSDVVKQQLRSLQILETVHLITGGYPHQLKMSEFVRRYRFLAHHKRLRGTSDRLHDDCKILLDCFLHIMDNSNLPYVSTRWALGTKHIFLSVEAWQCLERLRDSRRDIAAVIIQSYVRRWSCKTKWPTLKSVLRSGPKRVQFKEPIYEGIQSPHHQSAEVHLNHTDMMWSRTVVPYAIDSSKPEPPPVPKNRPFPYTVTSSVKSADFPQTRIMTHNFPADCKDPLVKKGELILVMGPCDTDGFLVVEFNNYTLKVPHQHTQLKPTGYTLGTRI
ncbi:LOW QUALITY PROTEIN: myosin-I heavy chain-like [Amphiura filiformis]|uniref:LOW QUALITY PROTEIN: myosin-I heavy chain-like n=1 Tax=Amphiura filiformis TaxID=82378 RepID=UPI003B216A64